MNSLELDIETSSLWLPYTINVIINHSIDRPFVSSFYKILTVIFQVLDWNTFLENTNNNCLKEKIIEYINCVVVYVNTFKEDLQFCCLEMFLSLPSTIVKEIHSIHILNLLKVIV